MTYPQPSTLQVLAGIVRGGRLEYAEQSGEMGMVFRDGTGYPVTGDDIDALTERGWVTLTEDEITATESGRYWLARWMRANKLQIRD